MEAERERTVREFDVELDDGRTLHAYDAGGGADGGDDAGAGAGASVIVWHHGTPNIGAPPAPLFATADRLGLRWVSYDRPGYGGSTPHPGRDVASAAGDVAAVADALRVDRFAVMGHSGGGPHALACAALLADRVIGVISAAGLAPFGAAGLDWFAGMVPSGRASLTAAAAGREAKERHEASGVEYDMQFTAADLATLAGDWGWLGSVVGPAVAAGRAALIDDDLAYVAPWGFDPGQITAPLLLLHGARDGIVPSSHGEWLAAHCPTAQLRLTPDDGHLSVLEGASAALEWLVAQDR